MVSRCRGRRRPTTGVRRRLPAALRVAAARVRAGLVGGTGDDGDLAGAGLREGDALDGLGGTVDGGYR